MPSPEPTADKPSMFTDGKGRRLTEREAAALLSSYYSDEAKPAPPARVRLSAVKVDVENAFSQWINYWYSSLGPEGATDEDIAIEKDILAARDRAMTHFAQDEADRKQLVAALAVLQAIVTVHEKDPYVGRGTIETHVRMAKAVLGHPCPKPEGE